MINSTTLQTFRVSDAYLSLSRYNGSVEVRERKTGDRLVVEGVALSDLRESVESFVSGCRYEERSDEVAAWLEGVIASATRALETHRPAAAEAAATEAA